MGDISAKPILDAKSDQYEYFVDQLKKLGAVKSLIRDKSIEADELIDFFDRDGNHVLNTYDLGQLSPKQAKVFGGVTGILAKHGFHLSRELVDYRPSTHCVDTGTCQSDIPLALWYDRDFLLDGMENDADFFLEVPEEIRKSLLADSKDNREFWVQALQRNEWVWDHLPEALKQDVDFWIDAVMVNGLVLQFIPEEKREKGGLLPGALVETAVEQNPLAFEYAGKYTGDPKLLKLAAGLEENQDDAVFLDEEFWLNQLEENPALMKGLLSLKDYEKFWDDRLMYLLALERNSGVFPYLPKDLREDQDFLFKAVQTNGVVLDYLSEYYQGHYTFLQEAAKTWPAALKEYGNEFYRSDSTFLTPILQVNGNALKYLEPVAREDPELVALAVREDGASFEYAADSLKQDEEFLTKMARIDWRVLDVNGVDITLTDKVLSTLLKDYQFPFEVTGLFDFLEKLKKGYGIEYPYRIRSLEHLSTLLKNRYYPVPEDKTLALIVMPRADHNGAFETYPVVDRFMEREDLHVFYYEAADEKDLAEILKTTTSDFSQPLKYLWIGGHGSSTTLSLGAEDPNRRDNKGWDEYADLDTSDFGEKDHFGEWIYQSVISGGYIVLDACLTAEGGEENPNNLTNILGGAAKEGVSVYGAKSSTNIKDFSFDDSGAPVILWRESGEHVVKGSRK